MKRFLTSILIAFCFVGMGFAKTYNIKSDNDTVKLQKSDVMIVELSENPSTGYSWEFISSDENVLKILSKKTVYPKLKKGEMQKCGVPGTAVYKIKAINKGTANIKGVYVRPWEKEKAFSEYSLNVIVE